MSNEIDGVNAAGGLSQIAETASNRRISSERNDSASSAPPERQPGDTVALTTSAKILDRVAPALAAAPDIDVQRVEEVRAQLSSGNYQIDDQSVADKLLRSDRERG
ncbi:MAG: flagellar biosynthesis anti-sigma factor FlgM [Pseudomonadota bacterium]